MEYEIKDKTVVVTGGAIGIGFSVAEAFIAENAKQVIILDIDEVKGTEAVNKLYTKYGADKAYFYKCDVTNDLETVFDEIVKKFESIDVLVNNAGLVAEDSARKTIGINTIATIEWTMKFWELNRKDKNGNGGTVLNLASVYGFFIDPFLPFYKASKFAVMGFTRSMGHEFNFNQSGVRIIALCPGFTKTNLKADIKPNESHEFQIDALNAFLDLAPWQTAEEVGKAAVDVFRNAKSGTAWMVVDGKPVEEVTAASADKF